MRYNELTRLGSAVIALALYVLACVNAAHSQTSPPAGVGSTPIPQTRQFSGPEFMAQTPADPTGTASTASFVMAGLAAGANPCKFTPKYATAWQIEIFGVGSSSLANDGGSAQIAWSTTPAVAIPANGAAAVGTVIGKPSNILSSANNATEQLYASFIISGLTTGVEVWFDFQIKAVTGGTFTPVNLVCIATPL
jgi:hypothetical protein